MATPALEHWFSVDIRRNRKSFILSVVALNATFVVAYLIWLQFAQTDGGKALGGLIFGLPAGICNYLLVAQRLRDFAVSGWFALLWIPINLLGQEVSAALTVGALLVLCGIPGTIGPNKFGEDPLENGWIDQ